MSLLTSTGTVEYTVVSVDELATLRAELEAARAKCERYKQLIGKLIATGDLGKPYARNPPNWHWECMYCECEWDEGSHENHYDHCPVLEARAALEEGE